MPPRKFLKIIPSKSDYIHHSVKEKSKHESISKDSKPPTSSVSSDGFVEVRDGINVTAEVSNRGDDVTKRYPQVIRSFSSYSLLRMTALAKQVKHKNHI